MKHFKSLFLFVMLIFSLCFLHQISAQEKSGFKDSLEKAKPEKDKTSRAWKIDSIKYKTGHLAHQRYLDSLDIEFKKLSPPLRKLERELLDLLNNVESHAITRLNVKTEATKTFFLKNNIHADTLGRIRVDIYLRNLKKNAYDSIVTSGARIIEYVCDNRNYDEAVVNDLKANNALVDQFSDMSYETMTAFVQFDALAKIAKISSVLQIKFPPQYRTNTGSVTSAGDMILNEIQAQEKSVRQDSVQRYGNATTKTPDIFKIDSARKRIAYQNWRRYSDSIKAEKAKLPPHMHKLEWDLAQLVLEQKAKGITAKDAKKIEAKNIFSKYKAEVDTLGRIRITIYTRHLDLNALNDIFSKGTELSYGAGDLDPVVAHELKQKKIQLDVSNKLDYEVLYGIVSIDSLEQLGKVIPIWLVQRGPIYSTNAGLVTTEGDNIIKASQARDCFYVNGSGSVVGIISQGIQDWTVDTTSNDLPGSFQVIRSGTSTDHEGTAMSEIVHDIAPRAALKYYDGSGGGSVAQGINSLISNGCKVVVDDLRDTYGESPFMDGVDAIKVNDAVRNGIIYISAASNFGGKTYDAIYQPDASGFQYFSYPGNQNWFLVPKNATLKAYFHWSEPWGSANQNYEFVAYRSDDLSALPATNDLQGVPQAKIEWTNSTAAALPIYFQICGPGQGLDQGRELKMRVETDSSSDSILYPTHFGGIAGHMAADSCLSIGAVNFDNIGAVAWYSSEGPTPIYTFNANGTVQSIVYRSTPTLSAIDKVQTRVGQAGLYWLNPFTGTSASAPHIAGVIALMLQVNPNLTWSQIKNNLQTTATSVSGAGGAGLVNAYEAVLASVPTVTNMTFNSNTTLNSYTHYLGTTTIQSGITVDIPPNITVIFENNLLMNSLQSSLKIEGTMIGRNMSSFHGIVNIRPFGGRLYGDGSAIYHKIEPSQIPSSITSSLNTEILDYGLFQLNTNAVDSLSNNSITVVDSGGTFNLEANSKFFVQSTCSLQVKGGGVVNILSGAQLSCTGTLTVDQGGTVEVGTGGTLRIETGGLMQLLAGGNGSVVVDSGGQVICYGTITTSDTLLAKNHSLIQIQSGGQLTLNSGSAVVLDVGAQFTNYGTTMINSGSILDTRQLSNVLTQNGGTTKINQGSNLKIWGDGSSSNASLDCYGTLSNGPYPNL